jgi:PPM family protein phosphatase
MAVEGLRGLGERVGVRPEDVRTEVAAVSERIVRAAASSGNGGMGTTVAGLGVVEVAGLAHWVVFNVGDSRVYRFVGDELVQLTVDHNEIAELLSAGMVSVEEAREHPSRNVVTRALGMEPAPETDLWVFPPAVGERFLICSDGLPAELDDARIAELLRVQEDPQRAADSLVESAVRAGGRDNVSVIVVDHVRNGGAASSDTVPRSVG